MVLARCLVNWAVNCPAGEGWAGVVGNLVHNLVHNLVDSLVGDLVGKVGNSAGDLVATLRL